MFYISEEQIDRAVDVAYNTTILKLNPPYENERGVTINDYLEISASDAVELGINLSEKDKYGKPRFHWYSDIGSEEYEDAVKAILRPLVYAAIIDYEAQKGAR